MTFRATAFPLRVLFPFSSQPPALNHTMNVNAGLITLWQEISFFLNDATVWSHPVSLPLSLSVLRFKCKLVYFQKRKKKYLGGQENDPEENHRCSSQVNPTPHTCNGTQMIKSFLSVVSLSASVVCVCVCVCYVGRRNPAGLRLTVHSWTWTIIS